MALEYDIVLQAGLANEVTLEGRPTDPSACYLLQKVSGLDGRPLTEEVDPLAGADGDALGVVTSRGAVLVLEGKIVAPTRLALRDRERALRAAVRPTTSTWPLRVVGRLADPEPLRLDVRVTQPLVSPDDGTDASGWWKDFQVAVRSSSATLRGEQDNTQTVRPPEPRSGITFPLRFPLVFAGQGSGAEIDVLNDGDAIAWPVLRITGRTVDPVIENLSSGEAIYLQGTVSDGEFLDIDTRRRTVTLNGPDGPSRYYLVRRDATEWWPLYPGTNTVRMTDSEHNLNASCQIRWADAYL